MCSEKTKVKEVRLTYHVTRREALPSHLSHLEEGVRDVFRAFRAATAEWRNAAIA